MRTPHSPPPTTSHGPQSISPGSPTPRRPQPFFVQVADLLRIELTNWRWTWRHMIVLGMGTPLGTIVAMRFVLGRAGPETLGYVFAGNLALSLIFENQLRVSSHVVF